MRVRLVLSPMLAVGVATDVRGQCAPATRTLIEEGAPTPQNGLKRR
jgi:hypothetical protein